MNEDEIVAELTRVCAKLRTATPPVVLTPNGNSDWSNEDEIDWPLEEQVAEFTRFMGLYRLNEVMDVIEPRWIKGEGYGGTSYTLKHIVEKHTGYICNGVLILAMYLLGHQPHFNGSVSVNATYPGMTWVRLPGDDEIEAAF